MTLKDNKMTISNAMSICHYNGIKVFPDFNFTTRLWQVKSTLKDKPLKTFEKEVREKELNEALTKVYIYYASKL